MKGIVRLVVVVALLGIGAYLLLGGSLTSWRAWGKDAPITIDRERARERGADLAEKAAEGAERVKETVQDAALTTKIKAKMALDDTIKARSIDVTTSGTTVTLAGQVGSRAEHDRAVSLARETDGVTEVIDRLRVGS